MQKWIHLPGTSVKVIGKEKPGPPPTERPKPTNIVKYIIAGIAIAAAATGTVYIIGKLKK